MTRAIITILALLTASACSDVTLPLPVEEVQPAMAAGADGGVDAWGGSTGTDEVLAYSQNGPPFYDDTQDQDFPRTFQLSELINPFLYDYTNTIDPTVDHFEVKSSSYNSASPDTVEHTLWPSSSEATLYLPPSSRTWIKVTAIHENASRGYARTVDRDFGLPPERRIYIDLRVNCRENGTENVYCNVHGNRSTYGGPGEISYMWVTVYHNETGVIHDSFRIDFGRKHVWIPTLFGNQEYAFRASMWTTDYEGEVVHKVRDVHLFGDEEDNPDHEAGCLALVEKANGEWRGWGSGDRSLAGVMFQADVGLNPWYVGNTKRLRTKVQTAGDAVGYIWLVKDGKHSQTPYWDYLAHGFSYPDYVGEVTTIEADIGSVGNYYQWPIGLDGVQYPLEIRSVTRACYYVPDTDTYGLAQGAARSEDELRNINF